MTTEEKAKAYDEALKDMRIIYPNLKGDAKLAIEHAFPELREGEDERIRKYFIWIVKNVLNNIQVLKLPKEQTKELIDNYSGIKQSDMIAYLEKQKEQNDDAEEYTDFTIYHPLKNGKGEYECIPYSFYGSLTSFSEDKDLIDFLRTCFYTKEECNKWIEQQKEQKPAEKQDYSGFNDLERAIHRGFLCAGVENVPVTIIKETAQECLAHMKPAKWSEEDEKRIQRICYFLLKNRKGVTDTIYQIEKDADWLKSLRPSWKPSEDEERLINTSISFLKDFADKGYENAVECIDWLKSKLNGNFGK